MRLRTGMMAFGAASVMAIGVAGPAFAEGTVAEPKLEAEFTDRDATDGKIAVYIDNCESKVLSSTSEAFTATDWNAKENILTATLKDDLKNGVYKATTTCLGMEPVVGKFEYRDGKVGVPGFEDGGQETPDPKPEPEKPRLHITVTDGFVGQDRKVGVRVTGCESGDLTATSKAFASTNWNPKTSMLTAILKKDLDFGTYKATFDCAGQKPLTVPFKYTEDMVGDKNDKGPKGDDKPAPDAPETDLPAQDQTSVIPEGGVQTGGGGTAPGQA